ncbi:glucosidase 2 subunit beta [Anaeramoeba flamelloides]|uniref:Glucosidase 2 subunit beta n=1 Tax=Anaeramoeba flamelloides TaxID=1746091 RepID=A0AAV8A046_9EUKA|nr:glucosidase 2 subunit beta [Anaeramoeba flamelloides]
MFYFCKNFFLFLALLTLFSFCCQATITGFDPSLASHYSDPQTFTCLDNSKTIPKSYVNDNYCDCEDGSDEPGTSACPKGTFYCHNDGLLSKSIPSSRVNDGVCDCCSGEDETSGKVKCTNTCKELYLDQISDQLKEQEIQEEGYKLRLEIRKETQYKKQYLQEQIEIITKEYEKAEQESENTSQKQQVCEKWIYAQKKNRKKVLKKMIQEHMIQKKMEMTSSEEKSSKGVCFLQKDPKIKKITKEFKNLFFGASKKELEDLKTKITREKSSSFSEKRNKKTEKEKLEKIGELDLGFDNEFYSLVDNCIEYKENKYTYEVCPFDKVTQTENGKTYKLGNFKQFRGLTNQESDNEKDDENGNGDIKVNQTQMKFTGGDKCWNGPNRSTTVLLKCGLKNEIKDAQEVSICEYQMTLLTPIMCEKVENTIKIPDLTTNKEKNNIHDEL